MAFPIIVIIPSVIAEPKNSEGMFAGGMRNIIVNCFPCWADIEREKKGSQPNKPKRKWSVISSVIALAFNGVMDP